MVHNTSLSRGVLLTNIIRVRNFKSLRDTGNLEIRPITLLVGPNSSGKSSFIQSILALRQTVRSTDQRTPLVLRDEYIDLGSYKDVIFKHEEHNELFFSINEDKDDSLKISFSVYTSGISYGKIYIKQLEYNFAGNLPESIFSDKKKSNVSNSEKEKKSQKNQLKIFKKSRGGRYYASLSVDGIIKKEGPIKLFKFYSISEPDIKDEKPKDVLKYLEENAPFIFASMELNRKVESLFRNIYHIGPLRNYPLRTYITAGASPTESGERGQYAIDVILSEDKIKHNVEKWLQKLGVSSTFNLVELEQGSRIYRFSLVDPKLGIPVNLTDVGFGASQVIPIIVDGFFAPKGTLVLIEQPEIHLHPKAQCTMGDLLIEIAKSGKRLIVETHSDLIISRLCTNVLRKDERHIDSKDIIIYYFDPTENGTEIKKITINDKGQLENAPAGFFEEGFREAIEASELMPSGE